MRCAFCLKVDVPYDERLGIHHDYYCLRCEGLLRKLKKQRWKIVNRGPKQGIMFTCFSDGTCEVREERE